MRAAKPSVTARWIATQRATLAPTRPSTPTGDPAAEARLYHDLQLGLSVRSARTFNVDLRTRFIDNEVAGAIGTGVDQIVLLGAGYDGRAFRFGGGSPRWFEVDHPATQRDKQRRLTKLGLTGTGISYVALDFMTDDAGSALERAGHDQRADTLFVCEGLLTYLSLEAIAGLLRACRGRSTDTSRLVLNVHVWPETRTRGRTRTHPVRSILTGTVALLGESKRTDFQPGDIEKLLTITGWRVTRSERSAASRLDGGSYLLLLAAQPAQPDPISESRAPR